MARRGENFRKEVKLAVCSYILKRRTATLTELSTALSVSRVTLSGLLDELVERGALARDDRRAYYLRSREAVLLKVGINRAQIVRTDLRDATVQRTQMKLLPSMSYEDNVVRLSGMAERYISELSNDIEEPDCALICYGNLKGRGIPKAFTYLDGDKALARGLSARYGESATLLYLDIADKHSCLSYGGKALATGVCSDKPEVQLKTALSLVKPQRLSVTNADRERRAAIERVALDRGLTVSFEEENEIYPDEYAALIKLLEKYL